jgi:nucleoside-diphosphate-sugar epimerase
LEAPQFPPNSTRQTLVTGATGIAGRHVVDALEKRGLPVLRVSRRSDPNGYSVDVSDPVGVAGLPDFGGVVHCAGLTPRGGPMSWNEFHRTNVVGSMVLAAEAAKRGALFFVYISTAGRLGRHRRASAARLYVVSKYLAERRIRQVLRPQVPALSVRAASLYGEYDSGSMSRLIRAVAMGRFVLPVGGAVPKCLLYAGTLARVVTEEIASQSVSGWRARRIADLRAYTLAEVVGAVESAVNRRARRIAISPHVMSLGIGSAEFVARLSQARPLLSLLESAKTALTPVPCPEDNLLHEHPGKHIDLSDGVHREVEWLRANRLL